MSEGERRRGDIEERERSSLIAIRSKREKVRASLNPSSLVPLRQY
jgi:hypothetical protein